MRVAPFDHDPAHADQLRGVCLATASERARSEEAYGQFTQLMYCLPYLEHGIAFMLVDDQDVAHGYTLSSGNWDSWEPAFEPYAEKIRALGPEFADRLENEVAYYRTVADRYPAHLHIDIEAGYQGGGNGRALMEALLDELRAQKVRGVSFGVAADNTNAIGFYEHMGFEKLVDFEGGVTFAMDLC